jgi:hypothetical protein
LRAIYRSTATCQQDSSRGECLKVSAALASSRFFCDKIMKEDEEVAIMNARAWESFVDKLLVIGVNSVQGLIRIAIIVAVAYFITKLLRSGLNRMEAFLIRATQRTEKAPGAAAMRVKTLVSVLWTIGWGLLWFVVVLIAFSQVGVNIGPILAGAGVVGLAIGFGAQHLVRDLVSGFFILLENQIRVGDIAIINGNTARSKVSHFARSYYETKPASSMSFPTVRSTHSRTRLWTGPPMWQTSRSLTGSIPIGSWKSCARLAPK